MGWGLGNADFIYRIKGGVSCFVRYVWVRTGNKKPPMRKAPAVFFSSGIAGYAGMIIGTRA